MAVLDNIRRFAVRAQAALSHQTTLDSALGISMVNQVMGDYLEFGVFRADRLIQAYETATAIAGYVTAGEGLPKAGAIDVAQGQEEWIGEGGFSASLEEVTALLPKKARTTGKIKLVKGWFNETLTDKTKTELEIKSAAIVYIDCDYYESTVPCLEFVTDLLVDGSILIFDDWWIFKGRSDRGEQRAFHEWQERHKIKAQVFIPGTAMSFMIQRD